VSLPDLDSTLRSDLDCVVTGATLADATCFAVDDAVRSHRPDCPVVLYADVAADELPTGWECARSTPARSRTALESIVSGFDGRITHRAEGWPPAGRRRPRGPAQRGGRLGTGVTQAFSPAASGLRTMTAYTATVTVRLKRGVLDPEAETTRKALERLGFGLSDLRSADRFEVDLEAADAMAAKQRATEMAERLLANPTIHDYEVAVAER
jgi:phosphoribosylformylglycinamidine synthase